VRMWVHTCVDLERIQIALQSCSRLPLLRSRNLFRNELARCLLLFTESFDLFCKGIGNFRIKLATATALNLTYGDFMRERFSICAVACHGIIGISHTDNTRDEWYVITG